MKPSIERARNLRSAQTAAEKAFWRCVRNRGLGGLKFKRQVPIGAYTADFYVEAARLVIELDGDQHGLAGGIHRDAVRDKYLRAEGYEVLRIWNRDVYERVTDVLDQVLHAAMERIAYLQTTDPSPENASAFSTSPKGEVTRGAAKEQP